MSISSIDQGQRSLQTSAGPSRPSVSDLLLNDTQRVQLHAMDPHQLASFRAFQSGVLGNIDQVQNGMGIAFPPFPTPCPIPPQAKQEPIEILKKQDPAAYTAFTSLKPDEQQAFLRLITDVGLEAPSRGGMGGMLGRALGGGMIPPPPPDQHKAGGIFGGMGQLGVFPPPHNLPALPLQINKDLLSLLKSGKLGKKDSQGKTLLQNLTHLSAQEMGPTLDRKTVFQELCSQIADPGRIVQGSHGTCAPTTIQHIQASKDPAEYARIMMGLASKEGTVTMKNGDELKRDRGSLRPDGNMGRNTISRLYQAAVMEYANGDDEYDNRTDEHTGVDDSTWSGQRNEDSAQAMEALFGKDYQSIPVDRGSEVGRSRTERLLREALSQGQQIPVALHWDDGAHMLSVVGMTEDTVVLRNPWGGVDDNSNQPDRGPDREALDAGGTIEMTKEEFFRICYNIILPGESTASKLGGHKK